MKHRKVKIWGSIITLILLLSVTVYFIVLQRAAYLLGVIVDQESNGKLKLELKDARFDLLNLQFDFRSVHISQNDTVGLANAYRISTDRLYLNVNSLTSVLFGKRISIDSILVDSPVIEVLKLREVQKKKVSITEELQQTYTALESVLKVVQLNSFKLTNATFKIFESTFYDTTPQVLSNIYLTIDSFIKENAADKNKFLYADRIVLEVYNADLALGDSAGSIRFKRFWMGTKSRIIKLDSCYIYNHSRKHEGNHYSLYLDSIRIIKLDLNAFVNNKHLVFDSAYCVNPVLDLALNITSKPKKTKHRLSEDFHFGHKIAAITGPMDAGHLALHNASVKMELTKNGQKTSFSTSQSGFVFDSLVIGKQHKEVVFAKKMRVDINNQSFTTADSLYQLTFDSLSLMNKKIILSDFELKPTHLNKKSKIKYIKALRFELDSLSWAALLTESRIDATKAFLDQPDISLFIAKKSSADSSASPSADQNMKVLKEKIKLNEFRLKGGRFDIEVENKLKLFVKNADLDINVNAMLHAASAEDYLNAINYAGFAKARIHEKQRDAEMLDAYFTGVNGSFAARKLTLRNENIVSELVQLRVEGLSFSDDSGLRVEKFRYHTLNADIQTDIHQKKRAGKSGGQGLKINLNDFSGGTTNISLSSPKIHLLLNARKLAFDLLAAEPHKHPVLKGLRTEGSELHFSNSNGMNIELVDFDIADNSASTVGRLLLSLPLDDKQLKLQVTNLAFGADINSVLQNHPHIKYLRINEPLIQVSRSDVQLPHDIKPHKKTGIPDFRIDNLSIEKLNTDFAEAFMKQKDLLPKADVSLRLKGMKASKGVLSLNDLAISMTKLNEIADNEPAIADEELLMLKATDILYNTNQDSELKWAVKIAELALNDYPLTMMAADSSLNKVRIKEFKLRNLYLNNTFKDIEEVIETGGQEMSVENGNISFENEKIKLGVHNLSAKDGGKTVLLDSITFSPAPDRESFLKEKGFQTVYMRLNSGNVAFEGVDIQKLLKDRELAAKKVRLNGLQLYTYKDKRYPFKHGVVKPMLTELLQKIKMPVSIDTLMFANSGIVYDEFNDRTMQQGQINLTKVRGTIRNIKTSNALAGDSLRFSLYARLLDTAVFRASYKQSYLDSLHGFKLNLVASALDIRSLNPMMHPFASASIISGWLDTLRMSAVGRKYVAFGTMRMYYKNLNVELINKGDTANKNFVTRSVSFLANKIVRKNHRHGKGEVYAERDFEKGFVNYWVKIVIGGVLTNTGVRSNRKQERKYEHAIRKHEVPPITDIPADF